MEIRREHDAIAALRAEWAKLDNPARIQELARRHLALKPIEGAQFDTLDRLPERPPDLVPVGSPIRSAPLIEADPDVDRSRPAACPPRRGDVDDAPTPPQPTPAQPRASRGGGARAHAALRPQRRPHRQGARRIGLAILDLRAGLCGHRRAPGAVRGAPDSHRGAARHRRRRGATARPDILDRNGEILATDVRTPSLFGEPHRIIDVDEAVRAADRGDARPRRRRGARAARLEAPLRLAQARDHAQAAASRSTGSACPASASCPRTSGSIRTAPRSRTSSATSTSTTRASPASRSGSTAAGSPTCTWPGSPPTGCRSRSSSRSTCASSTRCATS